MKRTREMKRTIMMLLLASLTGCTWYSARGVAPMMDRIEENKLVKMEKKGVTITAFPILNEDDSRKYFGSFRNECG